MNTVPNYPTTKSRDTAILQFLWRWKVSTTNAIALRFFPKALPSTTYNRLNVLKRLGLIELQRLTNPDEFVWALTEAGFEAVSPYLPRLQEGGFRSECPDHDLLTAACQLGPWLCGEPEGVSFFSDRELRSIRQDFYPEWVPKTTRRRPDGYWQIPYENKLRTIALEVERNKKVNRRYEVIASFYKDNVSIFRTIWLVPTVGTAKNIQKVFQKEVGPLSQKHNFVLIDDFESVGWQSPIIVGFEKGQKLAFVLGHKCINDRLCPACDMPIAFLKTTLRPMNSNTYAETSKSQFPNRIDTPSIHASLSNSTSPVKP